MSGIAILHPSNLLGKELTETIENRARQWREIRLLSTSEEEVGSLTDLAGAAALVARYEPESLQGISTVYFCGPIKANRPLFADLPPGATGVVLSPDATPEDGVPVVAGVNTEAAHPGTVLVSPHPAVVLLAHLLQPLRDLSPESVVATVIQPASMHDNPGLEELFEQTRSILSMSGQRPSSIFGTQLAFNLIPTTADALPLGQTLQRVIGGEDLPVSLQVVQGGVFHSLTVSLYLRLRGNASAQALRKAFNGHPYLELVEHPKRLGPIDAAASEKVLFGTIRKDDLGGFWIWAVMDNLTRGGALNAVEIVEAIQ
ncbi:MAG TPA: Asd/ArgC dimerization domain-containing protein [Thermoanaerobaculia bacterium]|nr:Asd/ArgC dimerization domain-containing protein [Thermoanaerobaculia bacterium]